MADRGAHEYKHPEAGSSRCITMASACSDHDAQPAVLPSGVSQAALLSELRRLSWGAADILRAYARGEQPPWLSPCPGVDDGGEGPVSAADLAVNQWLLDGLSCVPRGRVDPVE